MRIQYIAKYISLPRFTMFTIQAQAIIPEMKAAKNPTERTDTSTWLASSGCSIICFIFSSIAPKIGGSTIKKENLVAFSLSTPRRIAVEIVAPDLDIPGRIATACAKPIKNAFQ